MQYLSEEFVQVEHLGQLLAGPGAEKQCSCTDHFGQVPDEAAVGARVESERVEPDAVAGPPQPVAFIPIEQTSIGAALAPPFQARVHGYPLLRDAAYIDELFQQRKRLRWRRTREMCGLGFVVRDDADGVREGTVLGFGGEVEGWEAVSGEDRVEVFAGEAEGKDGGDCGRGLEDVEEEFVG